MFVLFGSVFVGTTAVQGKVHKIPIETNSLFDFSGWDPGTSWISGGVLHVRDGVNLFNFISGPIDGSMYSFVDVMNNKLDTGVGVGSGRLEIVGTWIGDDEFNGLPIYLYGQIALRNDGTIFFGWANGLGTLGDYKIHLKGDFITTFPFTPMSGELTIHL